ncbi:MAG: electron transfer flavoprotein subunit beta/FixA family protein [Candidatus Palauibacterales bacterium]|nr:electron transfer flavoprotein subunit beta/FixA family protein [Candidatus Palauibacterales bacterium]
MNIIVCVKRVPDSGTRVRVTGDGRGIDTSGVKYVVNPYDEFAVEEAIQIREERGEGQVTALCLGPDEAEEQLRNALAMGADDAVLLEAEPPMDGLTVARELAAELEDRDFDLLLFGKQAIDDDNMQVPPMVAEILGLPCATVVVDLDVEDGRAVARREVEGGHEMVELELPAVVSTQKGLNEPRYADLKGIMAAKKKPLEKKEVELAEASTELLSMREPEEGTDGEIVGEGAEAAPELARRLHEEAKVL